MGQKAALLLDSFDRREREGEREVERERGKRNAIAVGALMFVYQISPKKERKKKKRKNIPGARPLDRWGPAGASFVSCPNGAAKRGKSAEGRGYLFSLSFSLSFSLPTPASSAAAAAAETTPAAAAAPAPNSIVASFARFMDRWSDNPLRRFETEEWSDLIGY